MSDNFKPGDKVFVVGGVFGRIVVDEIAKVGKLHITLKKTGGKFRLNGWSTASGYRSPRLLPITNEQCRARHARQELQDAVRKLEQLTEAAKTAAQAIAAFGHVKAAISALEAQG